MFRPSPLLSSGEVHFINMILHKEFVPQGQCVNQQLYIGILKRMRRWGQVSGEDPLTGGALRTGAFPDDMTSHATSSVLFLTENNMAVVRHPPALPTSPL